MFEVRRYIAIAVLTVLAACSPAERSAEAPPATDASATPAVEIPVTPLPSLKGYDVVVAVVDGLRADRVAEAPFLAELAKQGVNFTDTLAASSHVLQSLAALSTGRLPTNGGTIGVYEAEPHDETTTLAQYFQKAG